MSKQVGCVAHMGDGASALKRARSRSLRGSRLAQSWFVECGESRESRKTGKGGPERRNGYA